MSNEETQSQVLDPTPQLEDQEPEVEEAPAPSTGAAYLLHNKTKSPQTRTARALAPTHPNGVVIVGGGLIRLIRNRPWPITEEVFTRLKPELEQLEKFGRVWVTDLRGVRISLSGDETIPMTKAGFAGTSVQVLDSADNDQPGYQDIIPKMGDIKSEEGKKQLPDLFKQLEEKAEPEAPLQGTEISEAPGVSELEGTPDLQDLPPIEGDGSVLREAPSVDEPPVEVAPEEAPAVDEQPAPEASPSAPVEAELNSPKSSSKNKKK